MRWALIMAGGSGERFWPKSRTAKPKQLLPITGERTMIQQTVDRLKGIVEPSRILIITNQAQHREMIRQLPELAPSHILAEPVGRDTAACIGLAALLIRREDQDSSMLVLPADHFIRDKKAFSQVIEDCFGVVETTDALMTIGITPSFPATGYGYLHSGEIQKTGFQTGFRRVKKFVEKPVIEKAKEYLESKEYFWNSGMFLWRTQRILAEIERQMSGLYSGLNSILEGLNRGISLEKLLGDIYPGLEKKSVDYGIMENAGNILAATASFDWDDIGSWEAIGKHFQADENGNVIIGQAKLINCRDSLIYNLTEGNSLMASAIDLKNMILVQTEDAVMVCPKDSCQQVKKIVEQIKAEKLLKYL